MHEIGEHSYDTYDVKSVYKWYWEGTRDRAVCENVHLVYLEFRNFFLNQDKRRCEDFEQIIFIS